MGEMAEMMLDGTMCEMCGTYIGDGEGFPRYCSKECAKDRGADYTSQPKSHQPPQDVVSIKITYNGNKVLYATQEDSTFDNAVDIAEYLTKYLEQALDIKPRFKHPKLPSSTSSKKLVAKTKHKGKLAPQAPNRLETR